MASQQIQPRVTSFAPRFPVEDLARSMRGGEPLEPRVLRST